MVGGTCGDSSIGRWSVFQGMTLGVQTIVCVVTRNVARAHAEMRQMLVNRTDSAVFVTQTLARKALGGGTPAVHHAP